MSARAMTAFIGLLTVALGAAGLLYPLAVMEWVGFAPLMTRPNAGPVEARAVYGGLFTVMGIFTLWAATAPRIHRSLLLLLACQWLGLFAGRMFGVSIDGSPGVLNTAAAVFEVAIGCLLLLAPFIGGEQQAVVAEPEPLPPAP